MAIIPGPIVTAPEPGRRRYGLFDAANGPLDLPTHGAGGGVRYTPVTCGQTYALGVNCYAPGEAPDKPVDGGNAEIDTGVFVTMASLECNAVGYTEDELTLQLRRRFEAGEQAAVEEAFWTGLDFDGNSLGIRSLAAEAEDIGGSYDPDYVMDVIGALERYAYTEQGYGFQAYLHAPVEVAAFAFGAGLVLNDSTGGAGRKVTPMGSIWSFGAYPAGSIIVTGQTTVWRGADTDIASAFHTTSNARLLLAERPYAVSFECFAGRAEFDPLEVTSP